MANDRKPLKSASHQAKVHAEKPGSLLKKYERAVTIGNVRRGLSTRVFKSVAASLGFSDRELAGVLKIPNRTLDRRFKHEGLSPDEADRLARVANILKRAQEVFGNVEKARDWMNTRLAPLKVKRRYNGRILLLAQTRL